jgi:hypothetical protein
MQADADVTAEPLSYMNVMTGRRPGRRINLNGKVQRGVAPVCRRVGVQPDHVVIGVLALISKRDCNASVVRLRAVAIRIPRICAADFLNRVADYNAVSSRESGEQEGVLLAAPKNTSLIASFGW